jgi:hypothetical protein
VNGWATAISKGPASESAQVVSFNVSNDNNGLFSVQPAVSAVGDLTYTLEDGAFGTATVTLSISDNGGTANSGADTSATQTFDIVVAQRFALSFDGTDDLAEVTTSAPQGGDLTVEAWVKPNSTAGIQVLLGTDSGTAVALRIGSTSGDGKFFFTPDGAGAVDSGTVTAVPGVWQHVAGVYDGSEIRIYVDGTLAGTTTYNAGSFYVGAIRLGAEGALPGVNFLDGALAEVRVSSIARYTSDFTPAVYLADDADTVALYHLDDGAGATAADTSANNDDMVFGAPTADPTWVTDGP